tara:strand:+ start:142 stop:495 length:354 start_codon:yes stop_codon:yes gene_type:complete
VGHNQPTTSIKQKEYNMPRTTFGKTRAKETPYATYANDQGWVWKVLKTYKHSDTEQKDPYARWFVAATSPMMHIDHLTGETCYELGDTYAREIKQMGRLVDADPEWCDEYGAPQRNR